MSVENHEKSDSSLRLAVISTAIILVVFGIIIAGYFIYQRRGQLLNPGKKKGDFLETFNDGKIDPKIEILTNGSTKYSIDKGILFFDQTTSPRDAHMWYYKEPLDLSRPFIARVRTKTANYVASAIQGCCPLILWTSEKGFPKLYPGGRTAHPEEVIRVVLHGAQRGLSNGVEMIVVSVDGAVWNFARKSWFVGSTNWKDITRPYPAGEFVTIELHSAPESFYVKWLDRNGKRLYKTGPKKWKTVEKIKGKKKIYLCGGEQLTSWWSNDQWVDMIQLEYER